MAESAMADHQHDYNTSAPSSPTQKRKRGGPDSSPDSRRSKRNMSSSAMSNAQNPPSAAYVEGAVEAARQAAQAAQAAEAATHADLVALQQATAERHETADLTSVSSTAAAALNSIYPHIHIPQTTEAEFAAQASAEVDHHGHHESAYNHNDMLQSHGLPESSPSDVPHHIQNGVRSAHQPYAVSSSSNLPKPTVGSEEWHKLRKDNHKNVERRRRETINEGINELAKIVPGCEKNKGSILSRAVTFIQQLKDNEATNIEKWQLEKLLTEQALQELSRSNDKLKQECERAYRDAQTWKNLAQSHGLELPRSPGEP
ncbi:hypothetical protein F5Y18DRAFT_415259 [Xylariaceae sp. FL1019]|nr:hypothetical protein F5Y18DRAFT_415259 [Xylariaceae sp. FL1019]